MLKVLRDNLKYLSWILWGVILVFIFFVFAEWGGAGRQLQGGQQVAVTVGDDAITFPELDRTHRNLQQTYRGLYGGQIPSELEEQLQLPLQAVQQLIRQRLMVQEARASGIAVSDEELAEKVLELPVFQDESGTYIGDENYRRAVRSLGFPNPKNFEETFRQELLVEKLNSMVRDTVTISDEEVESAYRDENETARIDYVLLPADRFAEEVDVDDAALQEFFNANSEDFRLPERRVVRYLFIDPTTIRSNLSVDDAEVEAYFQQNADDYRRDERVRARQILLRTDDARRTADEARATLADLRAQLDSGADFAALAAEYSEDPASRDQGGDLGYIARGEILPEVENAAFATSVGEIAGPIETSFGLHLVEVTNRQPGGLPPFEEVSEQVRTRMLDERATQAAADKAQQLAAEGAQADDPETVWPALADGDPGVSFFESAPFARNEPVAGIGPSQQFSAAAFSLDVGGTSPAVPISSPTGQAWAILNLVRIDEPRIPELSEVQAQVRSRFVGDRSLAVALERLEEGRDSIAGGDLAGLAAELDVEVTSTEAFNRQDGIPDLAPAGSGDADDLIEAALEAPVNRVIGPFETPRGAVLARVTERAEFDPGAFAAAREETEQRLRDEQAGRLINSLLLRRQQTAEIEYSPDLTAQFETLG